MIIDITEFEKDEILSLITQAWEDGFCSNEMDSLFEKLRGDGEEDKSNGLLNSAT